MSTRHPSILELEILIVIMIDYLFIIRFMIFIITKSDDDE